MTAIAERAEGSGRPGAPTRRPVAGLTALAACGAALSLLTSRPALADIAPTPPVYVAPPTFLFLFVAVYVLLLTGVGLGAVVRRVLKKPGGGTSQKRLLAVSAAVALALTVVVVIAAQISYRHSRADRFSRRAVMSDLGAIRSLEVAYYAEWNVWVGGQPLTPLADRRGSDELVRWDQGTRFSILGFAPEGKVLCSYALEGPAWSTEGFTARAECDYDRDGQLAIHRVTNTSNEILKSGAPF